LARRFPRRFFAAGREYVERNTGAGANVKDFSERAGGFAGEEIGLDGVFDEGEVAGLLAVAIDDRLTVL